MEIRRVPLRETQITGKGGDVQALVNYFGEITLIVEGDKALHTFLEYINIDKGGYVPLVVLPTTTMVFSLGKNIPTGHNVFDTCIFEISGEERAFKGRVLGVEGTEGIWLFSLYGVEGNKEKLFAVVKDLGY